MSVNLRQLLCDRIPAPLCAGMNKEGDGKHVVNVLTAFAEENGPWKPRVCLPLLHVFAFFIAFSSLLFFSLCLSA